MHYKQSTICRYLPHFHHFYAWWDLNSKFLLILCIYLHSEGQIFGCPTKKTTTTIMNYELLTTLRKCSLHHTYSWRLDWMPPFSSYSSFPLLAPIPICKWKSKKAEPSFLCYIVCTSNHTAILHHDCHSRSSSLLSPQWAWPDRAHLREYH